MFWRFCVVFLVLCGVAQAAPRFAVRSVVYYQPDDVFAERVSDPASFRAYVKVVERRIDGVLKGSAPGQGFQAALVVAVKPDGTARVWLVSKAAVPAALAGRLEAAASGVAPAEVDGGPVAFAVVFDAFGGGGPAVVDAKHPVPIPPEWRAAPPALGVDGLAK